MMAINHAVAGAIIGLSIDNPAVAMPAAFASHFVLDAVPHYDPPSDAGTVQLLRSKRFKYEQLYINGALCVLLVLCLAVTHPRQWFVAAVCAFLGTSPDLCWIPRFISAQRHDTDVPLKHWFLRFHSKIQWFTRPWLIWFELAWLAVGSTILWRLI